MSKGRVLVAMSGGVDSSTTALLLLREGWACEGVTMRLGTPANEADIADARATCEALGIAHHALDLTDVFEREVVDPYVAAYAAGLTPNPCCVCNPRIKFGALLDHALELGFDYLATGHYARIGRAVEVGAAVWEGAGVQEDGSLQAAMQGEAAAERAGVQAEGEKRADSSPQREGAAQAYAAAVRTGASVQTYAATLREGAGTQSTAAPQTAAGTQGNSQAQATASAQGDAALQTAARSQGTAGVMQTNAGSHGESARRGEAAGHGGGEVPRRGEAAGRLCLLKGADPEKDQSYFLYGLSADKLAHVLFPLGGLIKKTQVRPLAEEAGLAAVKRRESYEVCFVPDHDHLGFIERRLGRATQPGRVLDVEGRVLGSHDGALRYTIGQRKGLGVAADRPLYVCATDVAANTVTIGDESLLMASWLTARDWNWVAGEAPAQGPFRAAAKVRYRQPDQGCLVTPLEGRRVRVEFDEPQRALTPGQAVVIYQGDELLGGGTIE